MGKHDHISGRPRDYISRRRFYRPKHRGEYQADPHWSHIRCNPCEFRVKLSIQFGPPPDPILTVPVLVPRGLVEYSPPWGTL